MTEINREAALAHFGVKGMKWGVRKQKNLERVQRIAAGKASIADTLRFSANVTIPELVRNKGSLKKAAAGRAAILSAQKKRIQSGNHTKLDVLDRAINTPVIDLIRGR